MADLYGCFDAEAPPLSFTGVDDINFAVFEIVPEMPFAVYRTNSLRLRSNSAIADATMRAKSI